MKVVERGINKDVIHNDEILHSSLTDLRTSLLYSHNVSSVENMFSKIFVQVGSFEKAVSLRTEQYTRVTY